MESKTEKVVTNVYTYTNTEDGNPMEVLLIGADTNRIGIQNNLKPHNFDREHITTWLRTRYFFVGGVVYAQVPRRIQDFPDAARKQFNADSSFASDVLIEDEEVQVYYPKNETECVCLMWDTCVDEWSMKEVTQPSDKDNIDVKRGYAATSDTIWRSP